MKSRKVVTRSGRGFRGYIPSIKLKRMVEFESLLERDAIMLFELSPGIIKFQEQPEEVFYEEDGKLKRYYPDFELVLRSGEVLHVEVKPAQKLRSPKLDKKMHAIASHYQSQNRDFRILTDQVVRQNPRFANAKKLRTALHYERASDDSFLAIKNELSTNKSLSVRHLEAMFGSNTILSHLAHGELQCDLEMDLRSPFNFVRITKDSDHDALYI